MNTKGNTNEYSLNADMANAISDCIKRQSMRFSQTDTYATSVSGKMPEVAKTDNTHESSVDYAKIASKVFESIKQCLAEQDNAYQSYSHAYQMWDCETKQFCKKYVFCSSSKRINGLPTVRIYSTDECDTDVTITIFVELLNRFCFNTLGEVYICVFASKAIPNVKLVQLESSDDLQPFASVGIKPYSPTATASYDKQGFHIFKSWLSNESSQD